MNDKSKSEIKRERVQKGLPPLSEIWSTGCQDCFGNGLIDCSKCKMPRCDGDGDICPVCPTCSGTGNMMLVVECEGKETCNKCAGTVIRPCNKNGYRPLTVEEVEDFFNRSYPHIPNKDIIMDLTCGIIMYYKGKLVKLMPEVG